MARDEKVALSPETSGFMLWEPWISKANLTEIQPTVFEMICHVLKHWFRMVVGVKKIIRSLFLLDGRYNFIRSRVVVNVICENHLCLLLFIFWGGGRVLLPLGAVLFFGVIHSHGCCKKQLWPSTISNSLCNFGHTIDESCAEELRRPEKAQQW